MSTEISQALDHLEEVKDRIRRNLVAQGITVPSEAKLEEMASLILSVAGEPGLIWRGVWDSLATYSYPEAVYHNGSAYICLDEMPPSGLEPGTDSSTWGLLAKQGDVGRRGTGLLPITTAPTAYTTAVGGVTPAYRVTLANVKNQSGATVVYIGDTLRQSYYHYPVVYVDSAYVYCGSRVSIRGANGTTPKKGTDYFTDADKAEMVNQVKTALPKLTLIGIDANGVEHVYSMYGEEDSNAPQ